MFVFGLNCIQLSYNKVELQMSKPVNRVFSSFDLHGHRQPVKKILISTLGRSGSSMLFDAFSQLTEHPYTIFEPLHDMRKDIVQAEAE